MALPQGKLLKKNDKMLSDEGLEVHEYPWLDFSVESIVFTDNPRKNVIRKDFHDPQELSSKVKTPDSFSRPLAVKTTPLVPLDLTEDYKANLAEAQVRKRKRLMDEDEIFSLEIAELDVPGHQVDDRWSRKSKSKNDTEPVADVVAGVAPQATGASNPSGAAPQPVAQSVLQSVVKSELDKATTEEKIDTLAQQGQSVSQDEIEKLKNRAWEESYQAGFKQGFDDGIPQGETAGFAEGVERGKTEGFDSGFRDGEERGSAALDSKSNKYFSTLVEALTELEKLKNEILASGEDIFMELAKICCEKLVREQIQMSDESLKRIYESAVESFADKDRLSVEMHPSDAARLHKILASQGQTLRVRVEENAAFEPGDFKVEADHEIVTVDVKKALELLLENLRGELFQEQAASTKKVG